MIWGRGSKTRGLLPEGFENKNIDVGKNIKNKSN